jgi:hypothetical protein
MFSKTLINTGKVRIFVKKQSLYFIFLEKKISFATEIDYKLQECLEEQ